MNRLWMSGAAALMAVSIAGVQAQTQTPQTRSDQDPAKKNVTLRGCVYNEKDVPGRSPNVAERAGIMEDYILVPSASSASSATAGTSGTGTAGTAGTSGTTGVTTTIHKAFKLEKAPDDQLKTMVGKMVEVTGLIDAEAGDAARTAGTGSRAVDRSVGVDQMNLPEFEVSSIKEVPGTCPATPDIKK